MSDKLEAVAKAVGLRDLDLLKLADLSLTPEDAVAALRAKYPGAFPKDARLMSAVEFRDAVKAMASENANAKATRIKAQIDALAARLPPDGVRSLSREDFKKAHADFLRACR